VKLCLKIEIASVKMRCSRGVEPRAFVPTNVFFITVNREAAGFSETSVSD
jgi:hypothetical protein